MESDERKDLLACLGGISDPRVERTKKHLLIDIMVITVCAYICSAENWLEVVEWAKSRESWLKQFLELPNGIPSHDTFGRVFTILDSEQLQCAFEAWMTWFRKGLVKREGDREMIHIDGKVLRGSQRAGAAIGLVSAWCSNIGVVLGYEKYDQKELSEKKATEALLDALYLKGCIVTLDAGGATQKICEKIAQKEANFVISLKGNQGRLHDLAREVFDGRYKRRNAKRVHRRRSENEKQKHGRVEKRHFDLIGLDSLDLPELSGERDVLERWEAIKSLGRVKSWRNDQRETRYFFTSIESSEVKAFADAVRGHWKVENQLHWVLDVAFREDQGRVRIKNGAENVGAIRRIALNLLKQDKKTKAGIQVRRRKAGWNNDYLLQLLANTGI